MEGRGLARGLYQPPQSCKPAHPCSRVAKTLVLQLLVTHTDTPVPDVMWDVDAVQALGLDEWPWPVMRTVEVPGHGVGGLGEGHGGPTCPVASVPNLCGRVGGCVRVCGSVGMAQEGALFAVCMR